MRVGFDVTPLSERGSGVSRYTLELLRALRDEAPDVQLELLSNRQVDDPAVRVELSGQRWLRAPRLPSRAAWMQAVLPVALAARKRVEIGHFTNFDVPLLGRIPVVVTLHDMSLLMSPEQHPAKRVLLLSPLMRLAARKARAVVCPTASAAQDAVTLLNLDPDRVHVVSGAVAPRFRVIDGEASAEACRRFGLQPGFLLFVGTIEPRKNLVRLARAFARLRQDGFDKPLVICGAWGWKSKDLRPTIEALGIADAVVFTDYVSDEDLVALLNAAGAFVYPSLYEGFGLPIIEAFACGVPVVTSDLGAMAEVAGSAALLVDPTDEAAIAEALTRVLSDDAERRRLRGAGLERAAEFSHRKAALQAVAVYRSALGR